MHQSLIQVKYYCFVDMRFSKRRQSYSLLSNLIHTWLSQIILHILQTLQSLNQMHFMSVWLEKFYDVFLVSCHCSWAIQNILLLAFMLLLSRWDILRVRMLFVSNWYIRVCKTTCSLSITLVTISAATILETPIAWSMWFYRLVLWVEAIKLRQVLLGHLSNEFIYLRCRYLFMWQNWYSLTRNSRCHTTLIFWYNLTEYSLWHEWVLVDIVTTMSLGQLITLIIIWSFIGFLKGSF